MIKIQRFQLHELVAAVTLLCLFFYLLLIQPRIYHCAPATQSACTGNLKQLGTASVLYEGDNRGTRPGPQPMGENIAEVSWDRMLAIQVGASLKGAGLYEPVAKLTIENVKHSYNSVSSVFICQKDPKYAKGGRIVPLVPGSLADGMASGNGICRSYSLNLGSGQEDGVATNASAIPLKNIESAAGTVYLIENHGCATVFGQANIANDTTIVCPRAGGIVPADAFNNPQVRMHGNKLKPQFNVLMYDGHVEFFDLASMLAQRDQPMQYRKDNKTPAPATTATEVAK
jgi:prepilin-type processing-associated H-X9-DG protein